MEQEGAVVATQAPFQVFLVQFVLLISCQLIQHLIFLLICACWQRRRDIKMLLFIYVRRFSFAIHLFLLIQRRQLTVWLFTGLRMIRLIGPVQLVTTVRNPVRDLNL